MLVFKRRVISALKAGQYDIEVNSTKELQELNKLIDIREEITPREIGVRVPYLESLQRGAQVYLLYKDTPEGGKAFYVNQYPRHCGYVKKIDEITCEKNFNLRSNPEFENDGLVRFKQDIEYDGSLYPPDEEAEFDRLRNVGYYSEAALSVKIITLLLVKLVEDLKRDYPELFKPKEIKDLVSNFDLKEQFINELLDYDVNGNEYAIDGSKKRISINFDMYLYRLEKDSKLSQSRIDGKTIEEIKEAINKILNQNNNE